MAVVYCLIGSGVLDIGAARRASRSTWRPSGSAQGRASLILILLFQLTDRRWVWVLALIAQVWVFLVCLAVSGTREPPFEPWGHRAPRPARALAAGAGLPRMAPTDEARNRDLRRLRPRPPGTA